MSSLWTPGGERPLGRQDEPEPLTAAGPEEVTDEEMATRVEAMRAELVNAPVEVVLANHCYGLFELTAVYLSQQPPLLSQARLAIDALSLLVEGLEGRLGDTEATLRDGLSQLRLAYVQIDGAQRAGAVVASAAGVNGGTGGTTGTTDTGTTDTGTPGPDTQTTDE